MATYTLFSQQATGGHNDSDTTSQTLGVDFTVSTNVALTGIWQWSASGCTALPSTCAIWNVGTGLVVAGTQNNSPSWSGAAGSGWVKCSYDGSITLSSGITYTAATWNGATGGAQWYGITATWWTGSITNGPLSCINQPDVYTEPAATFLRPASLFGNYNIWIDVEVADITPPPPNVPNFTAFMSSM